MNERDQADLEMLKRRQEALQRQLATLTVDIENLSSRLNTASLPVPQIHPLEVPPLETAEPSPATVTGVSDRPVHGAVPPPLPPIIAVPKTPTAPVIETPVTTAASELTPEKREAVSPAVQMNHDGTSKPPSVPPPIPQPLIATPSAAPEPRPRET